VVTAGDARRLGVARATVANQYARQLEAAIRSERMRRAPSALIQSGLYGFAATLAFGLACWLLLRVSRSLRGRARRWHQVRVGSLQLQGAELVSADRVGRVIDRSVLTVFIVIVLVLLDLYLTYLLGLFPWTRGISKALVGYVLTPVRVVAEAVIAYIPKLAFVIVIAVVVRGLMRLVALFFRQIEHGRIVFANFPADWADPTSKIARLLLFAFGVIVVFPYLPASDSAAFTGVSVFMGVLLSLSSSSAIANAIAGIVLTYTSAFRIGDYVRIGDSTGDIVATSLLATRLRTIKNEDITIPNSLVLNGAVMNYSRYANAPGLILHTTVTIGYDAPWPTVHQLLIDAALKTPGIRPEPAPFVWQTALNDFYVTYEINAYTADPSDMVQTYAALHARIQDAFAGAGVEIMSPHYTSLRDGNAVTIPADRRAAGYRAPAFRVERESGIS
jgi:small-conductance mechanosensitive channel